MVVRHSPEFSDQQALQRKLCARIQRHLAELFVFVTHPEVPPDNNAAERSLRHLVTSRKISGGTRSPAIASRSPAPITRSGVHGSSSSSSFPELTMQSASGT